jgi:hypothetical protein
VVAVAEGAAGVLGSARPVHHRKEASVTTDGYTPQALAKLEDAIEKEESFRAKNTVEAPSESKLRMQQKLINKKLDEAVELEAQGL